VVQAAPAWLDLDAAIDKGHCLIEAATATGAKLIALWEVFISGYP
jgi:aliphatic nitrilase